MNSKASAIAIVLLLATLMVASVYVVAPVAAQADTDWPMFGHDPAHTRVSDGTAPDKFYVKWRYMTNGPVLSSPAVVDAKVYIGSDDNNLYCLDGNTGSLVWKYTTGNAVESSPAVVGGMVYFGSVDKNVYCLTTGGTLVWKYTTGGYVFSSPTVVDGKVYIGSMDKNLYCLNATTGTKIWNYTAGKLFKVSPAVYTGMVYFGSDDKMVTCLNATTGTKIWSYTTGNTIGQSSAAVADGRVFIGSDDTYFYCLNATTGTKIWSYRTPADIFQDAVRCSAAIYNGRAYIGMAHQFTVLDIATGVDTGLTGLWKFHTGSIQRSSPAIAAGNMYTGHNDLNIYIFDAVTGDRLQSYFASSPWESSVAIANGKIYCGNGNDYVYCFEQVTGTVPVTISCTASPSSVAVGTQVTVEGHIFPGVQFVNVDLTYTKPDGTTMARTVLSKGDGLYADSLAVDVPGAWTVMAQFNGYDIFGAAESSAVSFTVTGTAPAAPPAASAITCSVDSKTNKVSGAIMPGVSGATVTLTYWKPDATSLTRTVTTASDGTYTDTYTTDATGNWLVRASWAGNSAYKAATSTMVTFTAAAAAAAGIAIEYVYAIVVVIVIAIVAVLVYWFMKSRKK